MICADVFSSACGVGVAGEGFDGDPNDELGDDCSDEGAVTVPSPLAEVCVVDGDDGNAGGTETTRSAIVVNRTPTTTLSVTSTTRKSIQAIASFRFCCATF